MYQMMATVATSTDQVHTSLLHHQIMLESGTVERNASLMVVVGVL